MSRALRAGVRGGRRLPRVVRGALVALVSLLAMELATRVLAGCSPAVRRLAEPVRMREREPKTFAELRASFAEHLVPFRPWFGARCNAQGFHDEALRAALPPGAFRVVALGDSFAFANVPWEQAVLTVAEDALRRRGDVGPGRRLTELRIDNLGVPAAGIATYQRVYELLGRALSPDVVLVLVYLGNDPFDFAEEDRFGRPSRWPRSWLWTALRRGLEVSREAGRDGPLAAAIALPVDATSELPAVGEPRGPVDPGAEAWSDERPPLSEPVFSDAAFARIQSTEVSAFAPPLDDAPPHGFELALGELLEAIERDGRRAVVVLAPSRLQVHPEELARAARRARRRWEDVDAALPVRRCRAVAREHGVPLIDLTPAFAAEAARGTRLYLRNDTHWGIAGNRLAGEAIAAGLIELGIVPGRSAAPSRGPTDGAQQPPS